MLQIKTLMTAITIICIASVCLAGLVTFMLWREAGRMLHHSKATSLTAKPASLVAPVRKGKAP
ncbi:MULTISPECIES: hypothetical protein [Hyphomonas]|jgi:hypothetical protein|uniref:Uncharacterized protein n=1 Tax=Hyphomonas adhaerens MHS-3 TaxID=1280949 RepID=A0A069E0L0_9PROT|nr:MULTISPECIES: hypothetical protein [Hyphomonas]KCZ82930.1 hypothetical protein HAD_14622 [Hyphomonas adhaerens MHS-3]